MANRARYPIRTGLLAALLAVTTLQAGDAPKTAEVPDWALGALSLREIGGVRQKVVAYINKVAANSGELATNMGVNLLFPLFPVNAGIKPDGAAIIYLVAPENPKNPIERAMLLTVSDAAAVKTALAGSIGMPTEENGVMTYSILQLPPEPDKPLLVKFVRDNMLVAPSADILKKFEEFLGARDAATLAGDADAVLAIKIANFKRAYGDVLMPILDLQARMASATPEQGDALKARIHSVMDRVWQAGTLEARLSLDTKKDSASLELSFDGQPGSALAKDLSGDAPTVTGKLNTLLPYDPALLLTWNVNPADAGDALRSAIEMSALKDSTDPIKKAHLDLMQQLTLLAEGIKGDAIIAIAARDAQPVTPVLVAECSNSQRILSDLGNFYDSIIRAVDAELRPRTGVEYEYVIELDNNIEISNTKIVGRYVNSQTIHNSFIENMLHYKATKFKDKFVCSTGAGAEGAIRTMIQNEAAPAAVSPELKSFFDAIPKGTAAMLVLRPILALRQIAALTNPQGPTEKLTANLPTAPLALSVRVAGGRAALRLELPAAVPEALFQLVLRMRRAGMNIDELLTPSKDVPAPPAP